MKILILGSSGFVGKNIFDAFKNKFNVWATSRNNNYVCENTVFFDLLDSSSWSDVIKIKPDILINCLAYGVVKTETDIDLMYKTNYFDMIAFYKGFKEKSPNSYWIQIGTAFEYDIFCESITEETPCLPQTHYGVSKLMFSNYMLNKALNDSYIIIRPFALFGAYEDESKIIPALIRSQLLNKPLALSAGDQLRDYSYIHNLVSCIEQIILNKGNNFPNLLNFGSGFKINLRFISEIIKSKLSVFDNELWQWNKIPKRIGEPESFFSGSKRLASFIKIEFISLEEGLSKTIDYYKMI